MKILIFLFLFAGCGHNVWLSAGMEQNAKEAYGAKYFKIKKVKTKTKCYKKGKLKNLNIHVDTCFHGTFFKVRYYYK